MEISAGEISIDTRLPRDFLRCATKEEKSKTSLISEASDRLQGEFNSDKLPFASRQESRPFLPSLLERSNHENKKQKELSTTSIGYFPRPTRPGLSLIIQDLCFRVNLTLVQLICPSLYLFYLKKSQIMVSQADGKRKMYSGH